MATAAEERHIQAADSAALNTMSGATEVIDTEAPLVGRKEAMMASAIDETAKRLKVTQDTAELLDSGIELITMQGNDELSFDAFGSYILSDLPMSSDTDAPPMNLADNTESFANLESINELMDLKTYGIMDDDQMILSF